MSHTSVLKDRGLEAALYATAGIPSFWLVNLADHVVEVHREAAPGRCDLIEGVTGGQERAPAAFPDVLFRADELLS